MKYCTFCRIVLNLLLSNTNSLAQVFFSTAIPKCVALVHTILIHKF